MCKYMCSLYVQSISSIMTGAVAQQVEVIIMISYYNSQ